ncbi:LacI family DNA-binding transcriptional regulator [Aerococcus urinae]
MNKRVTIQEVADQAGVSKTTVSRYLNKKYHKMSPATKKRIKAVIEELDYRPSRQAQALKSKRSYLIGVVIADISNMYASLLLKGMSQVFNQAKWQMIILDSLGEVDLENQYLERLIDQNVDGIILQPAAITSENYQFIEDMQLPLILADRKTYPTQWLTIGTDNEAVISRLFEQVHLSDYQAFVVVSEVLAPVSTRQDRYQAVVTACAPAPVHLIEVGQGNWQEAILDLAARQKTLFFCNNGRVMIEVLRILKQGHFQVPQEVGVTGFDDWHMTDMIGPGITSIEQPTEKIGASLAENLLAAIQGKKNLQPGYQAIPSHISLRSSV